MFFASLLGQRARSAKKLLGTAKNGLLEQLHQLM